MSIKYLDTITSTNEYVKENISLFSHLDAVYTLCQTNGKGRLGRTWSADGGIALSFYVKDAENPMLIPLCAAVAVCNALEKSGINNLGIKWPNDILADGKKLCGILCEGVKDGYVVGIGINNKQNKEFFINSNLPHATSVAVLEYETLSEPEFVELCLQELKNALYLTGVQLIDVFARKCINLGKKVKIIKNNQERIALAVDISSEGGLVVEIDGKREIVFSGEVSVRGIYGYAE